MIQKLRVTILMLSVAILGFGQTFPAAKTAEHHLIAGTNILMIPPSGFVPAKIFKGFSSQSDPASMIMIMEIQGPYEEVAKSINDDAFKTRDMKLKSKNAVKIGEFDGVLAEVDHTVNEQVYSKDILIYGNSESSTLINGIFPKDSLQTGRGIRQSILTTVVDQQLISDPRAALVYSISESAGGLKFHSVMGNGMLFNRDLKTPTKSADRATLITDRSYAKMEIKDKKLFCISRIKKYPEDFSMIPAKGLKEIKIDGLSGYELYAKNNDQEDQELYQVILFEEDGGYYLFVGTYAKGSKQAEEDIRNVIRTFKRKPAI